MATKKSEGKSEDTADATAEDLSREAMVEERRRRREEATTVDGSESPSETESKD